MQAWSQGYCSTWLRVVLYWPRPVTFQVIDLLLQYVTYCTCGHMTTFDKSDWFRSYREKWLWHWLLFAEETTEEKGSCAHQYCRWSSSKEPTWEIPTIPHLPSHHRLPFLSHGVWSWWTRTCLWGNPRTRRADLCCDCRLCSWKCWGWSLLQGRNYMFGHYKECDRVVVCRHGREGGLDPFLIPGEKALQAKLTSCKDAITNLTNLPSGSITEQVYREKLDSSRNKENKTAGANKKEYWHVQQVYQFPFKIHAVQ